ncbi:hypothetical protein [Nocardioides sp.]|uniref:hypothetical protein n=1 Tax=Nocardioides sp. TaxID=35761 RepID=UPI002C8D5E2F|nr:hypothetical protein [Nocardioides sp.]HSX68295.1 hypothetical protein [Nocardioides sp.]
MTRLGAALLAVGLLAPAACAPSVDSALGRRPTSYPAVGQQSSAGAGSSLEARLVARSTAAVERALSYHHQSYAADTAAAQAFMTPGFAARWAGVAARLQPNSAKQRARIEAHVVSAGVSGATSVRAQVLLFVDRTLQTANGAESVGGYAVATLSNLDGTWLLSGLGLQLPREQVPERRPVPATVLAAATAVADAYQDVDSAHPHADVARILSLSTGAFRRAYEQAADELVARVVAARATQDGAVVSTALSSLRGRHARVIAVVETTLRIPGREASSRLVRLELDMVRTRTAWLARDISVVPAPDAD